MTSRAESRADKPIEQQLGWINADLDALDLAVQQVAERQDEQDSRNSRNTALLLSTAVGFAASAVAFALNFLR